MVIWTLAVLALVLLAFVLTPRVAEQEVWSLLEGPEWKTTGQLVQTLNEGKRVRPWLLKQTIFYWRVWRRVRAILGQGRLATGFTTQSGSTSRQYRNILWTRADRFVTKRGDFMPDRGGKFGVWVLGRDFEPELVGFVEMVGGIILISEDVFEQDRRFYCLHEVLYKREWRQADKQNQHLWATAEEIKEVRNKDSIFLRGYLRRRMAYYERLIAYQAEKKAGETILANLRASRARLVEEHGKFAS